MKEVNEITVLKTLFDNQCPVDKELWIYIDHQKNDVQLYTNGIDSEEQKVKYNFVKIAKKYGFVKSDKEFWKRIKDILIKESKVLGLQDSYIITYEMEI